MGMTGAGKSTFISLCTGQDVPVGHKLHACTQDVAIYKCPLFPPADVYLVDTPGFDDTNRSDTDVLKEIATWLTLTYEKNMKLSGILYLHRITDPRVGGSARRNLCMFRNLCGAEGVKNVLLVTTMWELVEASEGRRREKELVNTGDFWGLLIAQGAKFRRHDNSRQSGMRLLDELVRKSRVVMRIQKEMVSEHKPLDQTEAGIELESELLKENEKFKQELAETQEMLEQVIKERDEKSAKELRKHKASMQKKIDRAVKGREQLKVSMEKMHAEKLAELEQKHKSQVSKLRKKEEETEKKLQQQREQDGQREEEVKLLRRELEQKHRAEDAQLRKTEEETERKFKHQQVQGKRQQDELNLPRRELEQKHKVELAQLRKKEKDIEKQLKQQRQRDEGLQQELQLLRQQLEVKEAQSKRLEQALKKAVETMETLSTMTPLTPSTPHPSNDKTRTCLSLSGKFYSFVGCKKSYWSCPKGLEKIVQPDHEVRYIAIGMSGSWYYHYHAKGKFWTRWADSLEQHYPKFVRWIKKRKAFGCPVQLSLGSNGHFYCRMTNTVWKYELPQNMLDRVGRFDKIRRVWLGFEDDYVIRKDSGEYVRSLKHYPVLERCIAEFEGRKDIAMNVAEPNECIVVSDKGKSGFHFADSQNGNRKSALDRYLTRDAMDRFVRFIFQDFSTPLHDARLTNLDVPDIANPVYEIEDALQHRTELDPPTHRFNWCDGPNCGNSEVRISGLRYACIDCPPSEKDFCSTCVTIPGQGIDHDPGHRLVQLKATTCSLCQDVMGLKLQKGDTFRGPHRQFSAQVATFEEVVERNSCPFCAFVWTALAQHPVTETWPPADDANVIIRVRRPWPNCCQIGVVSDTSSREDITIRGNEYVSETRNVQDEERELEIYPELDWSHETPVGFGETHDCSFVSRVRKSSGSAEALELARMWLQNCRDNHSGCEDSESTAASSKLPIRMIDLQGPVESRVYLREAGPMEGEYAALSYCWGAESPGLFTSNKNFQAYQHDGVAIEDLPLTIRDAIHVTKKLGLRYLWVDRLCIIQDSTEDWTHQATLMCDVYSRAALTLSADGSSSALDGLYHREQKYSDLGYQIYIDSQGNDTPFLLVREPAHPHLEARAGSNNQPIDQRGWTMQERLMSRRVLHFTTDELVWECNELTECECRRQSQALSRDLSAGRTKTMDTLYDSWRLLVRAYAKRSLSEEMDKLPAFRGLVARFQQIMGRIMGDGKADQYLAGLWRGDLAAQLAWKPPVESDLVAFMKATRNRQAAEKEASASEGADDWRRILDERNRREDWHKTKGYVAPSWSWAHLHGPISYLTTHPRSSFDSYVDILSAETVPRLAGEPTGQVVSGSITLSGFVIEDMQLMVAFLGFDGGSFKDLSSLTYRENEFYIELRVDDAQTIVRERGCDPRGVVLAFLGTRDFVPSPGAMVMGLSSPCNISRRPEESPDDDSSVSASLPDGLVGAFEEDPDLVRFTSYLALAESQTQTGKYERLASFDVWGPQQKVMADLFVHSSRREITII
ncbi:heterokaryon incompatibility [Fusarium albosuccineum]|uniref:Heterokaryon incompatibility n=1 Tax=Fusarium albosuccineum TaxID=1237068 RepID=A0A8H4P4X6_9HYPO|nr:heterokaryon incompatibility [Fusarium albosuccineum]